MILFKVIAIAVFIILVYAFYLLNKKSTTKNRLASFRKSLDFSKMIIASVPMPLLVLDSNLKIITANGAFYLQFRLKVEEVESKSFFEILNGSFKVPEFTELGSIITKNIAFTDKELQINGRIISLSARKLYREFSNVHLILVSLNDVTETRHYEKEREALLTETQRALKEAEEAKNYFKSIFESAPGLYLVLSPVNLIIVGVSEAYLNATMTKREEIVGKSIFDVFPDDPKLESADGVKNLRASLERVKQNKVMDVMGVQRYPIRKPSEVGGEFEDRYWSPINSPVYDYKGDVAYIIHRVEDVTDYIRMKERGESLADKQKVMEKKQEYLEADIVLRSQELMRLNEKLRVTLGELERSNEALERYASIVSHDLNSPLYTLTGFSEMLANKYKDKLDVNAEGYLNFIIDSSKRMRLLVDNLLNYSRVTTHGKEFRNIEISNILNSVIKNLDKQINETNAEIKYKALPLICGDEIQILRLFQNLIENAIKFRRKDIPPVIEIGYQQNSSEGLFFVKDNGIGIDPQNWEKLFALFQRVHEDPSYPGTGIGLAECKKIVERHGGHIWVNSLPGQGSTFYFTLKNNPSNNT